MSSEEAQRELLKYGKNCMSEIESRLTDLEKSLNNIKLEQSNIMIKIDQSAENQQKMQDELIGLTDAFKRMEYYEEFKKNYLDSMQKWIGFLVILAPIAMSAIGYIAYDWGLYKPVPVTKEAKINK